MAFVLFGYDQGVFGGIVGNSDFLQTFNNPSSALEGIIVSSYNLGAFTGCIISFFYCEQLGRRKAMWLAMAFIIVSSLSFLACQAEKAGWSGPANNSLYRAAHDYSPLVHRYWDGY